MEFRFETQYNAKTMTAMARALRKTIRKKHSRRSHRLGWFVAVLAILFLFLRGPAFDVRTLVTAAAALVLVAALLFEDRLNGYIAQKRLLAGTERAVAVFTETGFVSETDVGKTEWKYDRIALLAETADFFVFIFSASHAQLYDKRQLQGGTAEEFRRFIQAATGKEIQAIG